MEPFALILAAMLAQTQAAAPPPPPPPPAARVDADGNGSVSRQEYMARFDRMDVNHDGQLSREERRAGRSDMRGGRRHGPDRGPNGDHDRRGPPGGVDAPDREMTRADFVARAGERFDRLDANRDGKVDRAEMDAARQHGRHRGGDETPPPPPPAAAAPR